jgi:alpha-L-fucosidase
MTRHDWFKQAKFGMMVHWGLYALPAGEWKGRRMPFIGEWAQSYFQIPNDEYGALASAFNPILFDADACSKHGLKLGLYYSQELDWHEPHGGGYRSGRTNCGCMSWTNDWDFPDNDAKDFTRCFEGKIKPQVEELLRNYGDLCLIWFDAPGVITPEQSAELFRLVKQHQPGCLVNTRIGNGLGDYRSMGDNEIPDAFFGDELVETAATLNDTWGYKGFDQNWKPAAEVLRLKKHLNDRGVNYLLNVGPDSLGRIPAPSVEMLKVVGRSPGP